MIDGILCTVDVEYTKNLDTNITVSHKIQRSSPLACNKIVARTEGRGSDTSLEAHFCAEGDRTSQWKLVFVLRGSHNICELGPYMDQNAKALRQNTGPPPRIYDLLLGGSDPPPGI